MRARTVLVAALLAGISVACSKPASESGQRPGTNAPRADREIQLVDEPTPGAAVVSALEAGLDSRLTLGRSTPRRYGESRMAGAGASPEAGRAQPRTDSAEPNVALTEIAGGTTATLPVLLAGSTLPAAPARGDGHRSHGESGTTSSSSGSRGPVILIRGGMGTPDDDCKIHPVPSRGHGVAINRIAPPLSGRVAINDRLPSGGTGFTRIR